MLAILVICAACHCGSPDTEGDTRQFLGVDFELCDQCAADWDTNGIPAPIAADYLG